MGAAQAQGRGDRWGRRWQQARRGLRRRWKSVAATIATGWRRWRWGLPLDQRGERAAERLLKRQGYRIVGRRERSRLGELDLVAVDGRTVVFVEVKTRQSLAAGEPAEAVDAAKQQRVARAAWGYLKRHGLLDYPARFDVVAVYWPAGARQPNCRHLRGAFEAPQWA